MDRADGWLEESGIGFRTASTGSRKYCRPESIIVARFGGKREPTWYPYTKARRGLIDRAARAFQPPATGAAA